MYVPLMDATVVPFFRDSAFDPETTLVMGKAFDRACVALKDYGQPDLIKEIIAKRIVEVAQPGERDPDRLRERALQALGIER